MSNQIAYLPTCRIFQVKYLPSSYRIRIKDLLLKQSVLIPCDNGVMQTAFEYLTGLGIKISHENIAFGNGGLRALVETQVGQTFISIKKRG